MNEYIPELLLSWRAEGHQVRWAHDATDLSEGDICFYLSYGRIVNKEILKRHKNNLVVHESNLPKGRGWSPLTWQILDGENSIIVTLFEAAEEVDSGPIYLQEQITFIGNELIDELRREQAKITIKLCVSFIKEYPNVINKGKSQIGTPTYYSRRSPEDSKIDLDKTIRVQFNLLRVADNHRYPIWFIHHGRKYILTITSNHNEISYEGKNRNRNSI